MHTTADDQARNGWGFHWTHDESLVDGLQPFAYRETCTRENGSTSHYDKVVYCRSRALFDALLQLWNSRHNAHNLAKIRWSYEPAPETAEQ